MTRTSEAAPPPTIPSTASKDKLEKGRDLERPVQLKTPTRAHTDETELLFTPYAWSKLKFMCHSVSTEIGGMAITSRENPLLVHDILIVPQQVNAGFVRFDPDKYADIMLDLCDPEGEQRLLPAQCQRIWIHTHPASCTRPSSTDEKTFADGWGKCDWAVMFILARSGETYARLEQRHENGLKTRKLLSVDLAWDVEFPASDHAQWAEQIHQNVTEIYSYVRDDGSRGQYWSEGVPAERLPRVQKSVGGAAKDYGYGYQEELWGDPWDDDFHFRGQFQPRLGYETTDLPPDPDLPLFTDVGMSAPQNANFRFPYGHLLFDVVDPALALQVACTEIRNTDLSEEQFQNLESAGLHLKDVRKGNLVVFQAQREDGTVFEGLSSDLLAETSDRLKLPVSEDAERELQDFEKELTEAQDDRDPLADRRPILNIASIYIDALVPWLCMNGEVIWVDEDMEYKALEDLRDGKRDYNEVADDFEEEYADVFAQNNLSELGLNDEDDDVTPLVNGSTPELMEGFTDEDVDASVRLVDAFQVCVQACRKHDDHGLMDHRSIESEFSKILLGAKTGGWLDEAETVIEIIRNSAYTIERATTDFSDLLLDISNQRASQPLRSQPQATDEEVQQALREGAP